MSATLFFSTFFLLLSLSSSTLFLSHERENIFVICLIPTLINFLPDCHLPFLFFLFVHFTFPFASVTYSSLHTHIICREISFIHEKFIYLYFFSVTFFTGVVQSICVTISCLSRLMRNRKKQV